VRYGSPDGGAGKTSTRSVSQKDSRFLINPLLRGPLSIEQEEEQIIQQKVSERIQALQAEALALASAEGYQQGLKQGSDEARKLTQAEGAEIVARFESLFADLDGAKDKIFKTHERFVIAMVYEIAQAVVLRELKTDREYVTRLAKTVIEQIGVRENVHIKIHPDDVSTIDFMKADLFKNLSQLKNLTVETSAEVRLGGCIVETELNVINATIENQLESFQSALLGQPVAGVDASEKEEKAG
jgi:flagellar biosynthesis/type III secretory pathway protein FliH